MSKYISVYAKCKCGHIKKAHIIEGNRPKKKGGLFASCGKGSYPVWMRYKGKCLFCNCNKFEEDKK